MSEKNSAQSMLNVVGFMLIVVGLGLEGPVSFFVIGAAIVTFLIALLFAVGGNSDEESDALD